MDSLPRFFGGLPNSCAYAWQIYKLIETRPKQKRFFAAIPDTAFALNLREDLHSLAPCVKTWVLPALETDLLKNRGPSLFCRQERVQFFTHLYNNDNESPQTDADNIELFLFTLGALFQKAPTEDFWKQGFFSINTGEELSRTLLADKLAVLGYLPKELVEKPFEYAVRGSIVDLFSPLYSHPVRIELYGDEVLSIRSFHPESQRRIDDFSICKIPPAREFLFTENADSSSKLRAVIRSTLDDLDYDKNERDALLLRFQQKSFFPTIDYWAPIIGQHSSNTQYEAPFPEKFDFYAEPHVYDAQLRLKFAAAQKHFAQALQDKEWVPASETLLVAPNQVMDKLLASISKKTGIWLESRLSSGLVYEPAEKSTPSITENSAWPIPNNHAQVTSPFQPVADHLKKLTETLKKKIIFFAPTQGQIDRANFLFEGYGVTFRQYPSFAEAQAATGSYSAIVSTMSDGFEDTERNFVLIHDEHLFGSRKNRLARKSKNDSQNEASRFFAQDFSLLDLKPNDFVTHKQHGVGRYLGLKIMAFQGIPAELLEIEYRDKTKLFVPVTLLHLVQKHSGPQGDMALDKLGGKTWGAKKARVKKELQSLAGELLLLYSKREMAKGPQIIPDEKDILSFASTFPFVETRDQAAAIEESLKDLRGPKPMDRLICGDVGYGKTEIALRAAHAAICAGFQVAVLTPTTLLTAQHENTFRKRLTPLGIRVDSLSRFKSSQESKKILEEIKSGQLQCVIGTHRLLGSTLVFDNLGLLVVDEEQRFGVAHKEKIKKLRNNVHVLSMTATPIPRTLNMAMSGIKELSVITTPPQSRLSIRTHIARKKPALIIEAIQNEIKRGGQVYYVHNRVQSIEKEVAYLKELLPKDIRINFAHGQMLEDTLEKRMIDFYNGRTQVFVSTSIVESGLDIPNANTLIVDRADMFGLAQLYQLRGRVGRSTERAYAYFLLPEKGEITQDAEERLAVLEAYQELGSGFHIASHDLELRGAGDFLGRSQSGHVNSIGFDAYTELLQEAIAELRGEDLNEKIDPEIRLGIDTTIPETYIPDFGLRLVFYRRLAAASNEEDLKLIEEEMEDRFGHPTESVKNLYFMMEIRLRLQDLGIRSLVAGKAGYLVVFDSKTPVHPQKMVAAVQKYPSHFQLHPDGRLLIKRVGETQNDEKIVRGISVALSEVASWCD